MEKRSPETRKSCEGRGRSREPWWCLRALREFRVTNLGGLSLPIKYEDKHARANADNQPNLQNHNARMSCRKYVPVFILFDDQVTRSMKRRLFRQSSRWFFASVVASAVPILMAVPTYFHCFACMPSSIRRPAGSSGSQSTSSWRPGQTLTR